jgi:DNA-directed RNA polymerase subunit RPC12/RpoP
VNAVFGCPSCGKAVELEAGESGACKACGEKVSLPAGERLEACPACGCEQLYRHRDFNVKVGIFLIVLGAGLSIWLSSFIPLVVAALIDWGLYSIIPDVAICYRCKAHFRDVENLAELAPFDLEIFEGYRWKKAREEGRLEPRETKEADA